MSSILELPSVRRRVASISVETYQAWSEQGRVDERTELLRGVIIKKMPKSPLHVFLVTRIYELARTVVWLEQTIRMEQPLTLADSEPEPDIAIVEGSPEDFRRDHPSSALLAIEVAVSTEDVDREKIEIYAEAAVAEYWLVLPASGVIEMYSRPLGSTYQEFRIARAGDILVSSVLPKLRVNVSELFGS